MKIQDKNQESEVTPVSSLDFKVAENPVYLSYEQEGLYLEVKPSIEPGEYLLVFKWDRNISGLQVENTQRQFTYVPEGSKAISFRVPHSQAYQFRFYINNRGEPLHWATFQGETPKDLIIRSPVSLSKDHLIKAFRLFVLEGGSIQTNGFNLHIDVKDLIWLSRGKLKTFSDGAKAAIDQEGQSGGVIYISAKQASGILGIEMRGQHGGDGSQVPEYQDRASRGHPGYPGIIRGKGEFRHCTQGGRSNGHGQDGQHGKDGKNGRRGGHSGYLAINIEHESDIKLNVMHVPGVAGNASRGTQGQKGGLAGKPYVNARLSSECGAPKMVGRDGKDGLAGKDGVRESDGQKIPSCINIASRRPECLS